MKTEVAVEKLCNIIPIIETLVDRFKADEKVKAFVMEYRAQKGISNSKFVFKFLPILLKDYREEVFEFLSIWNDKSIDEIKEQPFGKTISDVKAIFDDEDLRGFFTSSQGRDSEVKS